MLVNWQAWCRQLQTSLQHEAEEIITREGLLAEFFINFQILDQWYAIGAMITGPDQDSTRTFVETPINTMHKKMMRECLEAADAIDYAYLLLAKK
jgi:hypothetical protein